MSAPRPVQLTTSPPPAADAAGAVVAAPDVAVPDVAGPVTVARPRVLQRRVRLFVAATITYNVVEAVVALTAGTVASSSALIGFGLDSIIEVSSAVAVAWQFAGRDPQARERVALKIIAVSFFALAVGVGIDAVRSLLGSGQAQHSSVGLVLAALSLAIMPALSYGQRRTGRELGSTSAVADSKQTLLCTYLSAVLLIGLALNSVFGWSWADPVAALVIAAVAVREGRQTWRGENCCAPTFPAGALDASHTDTSHTDASPPAGCACAADCDCCAAVAPHPGDRS